MFMANIAEIILRSLIKFGLKQFIMYRRTCNLGLGSSYYVLPDNFGELSM